MPMLNRHIAIGGTLGCLLRLLVAGTWGWIVGLVVAFLSHFIDWIFNECWECTREDNLKCVFILSPALIVLLSMMWWVFGFWPMLLMVFASLLMDAIDGIIIGGINYLREERGLAPVPHLFPCHWKSPEYIAIFGKRVRWYRDPFRPEETLQVTIEWEFLPAIIVAASLLSWELFK